MDSGGKAQGLPWLPPAFVTRGSFTLPNGRASPSLSPLQPTLVHDQLEAVPIVSGGIPASTGGTIGSLAHINALAAHQLL